MSGHEDYEDAWQSPEAERYTRSVVHGLLPKLAKSSIVMSLVPNGKSDVKFAVELGFSIMMDKPIVAIITPGTKVPLKLAKVADEIVEGDITTPEGQQRLQKALDAAVKRLRLADSQDED